MGKKRRLTKDVFKMIRVSKLACMIGEGKSLAKLRKHKIINEDLFDMAEAHMIDVISFKPVKYRLTDKGREFYEEFFIGGALDLQGPEIEKIFNEWSKRREMKGGKRWKE